MKPAPKVQAVISDLCNQRALPLNGRHSWEVKFERDGYLPLLLQKRGSLLIVQHDNLINGELSSDPRVEFRITPEGWVPFSFENQMLGIYQRFEDDGTTDIAYGGSDPLLSRMIRLAQIRLEVDPVDGPFGHNALIEMVETWSETIACYGSGEFAGARGD